MRWSALLALVVLFMALVAMFGDMGNDRCAQPTTMTWVYCDSVQSVR